jgi:hypothetical protein
MFKRLWQSLTGKTATDEALAKGRAFVASADAECAERSRKAMPELVSYLADRYCLSEGETRRMLENTWQLSDDRHWRGGGLPMAPLPRDCYWALGGIKYRKIEIAIDSDVFVWWWK